MSGGIFRELMVDGVQNMGSIFTEEECTALREEVFDFLGNCTSLNTPGAVDEYDNFIYVDNSDERRRAGNLRNLPKPAVVKRGVSGYDIGMIDIFRADEIFESVPMEKMRNMMRNTMAGIGYDRISTECSIYYNKDIKAIRGFHRDVPLPPSPKKLSKFFVYLTDVPTIDYGPYCYLRGTHLVDDSAALARQLQGQYRDPNEYDLDLNPIICRGPAGTLIVSNQAGMHRGMPQLDGKERLALVCKARVL